MILIKTPRDTLLAPLQSVSGIVERRHTLPILSNVLLEKRGDTLTFLATDIEIQITTSTTCTGGEGDGAMTVGARKLQEILLSVQIERHFTKQQIFALYGQKCKECGNAEEIDRDAD